MTRDEMIEVVSRVLATDFASEKELHKLVRDLDGAAPGSRISDLIFYADPPMSADQIVDEALGRVGRWQDD